jgi:hypothetical protein
MDTPKIQVKCGKHWLELLPDDRVAIYSEDGRLLATTNDEHLVLVAKGERVEE